MTGSSRITHSGNLVFEAERIGASPRVAPDGKALAMLACALVSFLMIVGGGGSPAPVSELACQIAAACAALVWLWLVRSARPVRSLRAIVVLIAAIPVAQLIPLPPALWQALPDRGLLADALALVGAADRWHPLSIAPFRTLQAVLSLLPPLLAMALASQLDNAGQRLLLMTIAATGLLSIMVGALQVIASPGSPVLFYTIEPGVLHGFQANRNAQADVLLIALLALVASWAGRQRGGQSDTWPGAALLVMLFAFAVVLTTSRTGMVQLLVALGGAALMVRSRLQHLRLPRWAAFGATGLVVVAGLWSWRNPVIGKALARFDIVGEYRVDIWQDTLFAIGRSWPAGTGFGTFTQVFFAAERLEAVGITLPNRAHNEVLELALEGGFPALVCWALAAALLLAATARALRSSQGSARLAVQFAVGTLVVTALHSLVDYPFRSVALATLIGVAAGILLAAGTTRPPVRPMTETG